MPLSHLDLDTVRSADALLVVTYVVALPCHAYDQIAARKAAEERAAADAVAAQRAAEQQAAAAALQAKADAAAAKEEAMRRRLGLA